MSLFFITPLKNIRSTKIIKLAKNLAHTNTSVDFSRLKPPLLPPRNIDSIIDCIRDGRGDELAILEWLTLFEKKDEWNKKDPVNAVITNSLIWQCIIDLPNILSIALWRLSQYLNGSKDIFSTGLVNAIDMYKQQLLHKGEVRAEIIFSHIHNEPKALSKLALKKGISPQKLLLSHGLPVNTKFSIDSSIEMEQTLSELGVITYEKKYINYLINLSLLELDAAVERLLTFNDKLSTSTLLLNFLRKNYGPTSLNSRWKNLTLKSQHNLRAILGSVWFKDFEKIIFIMTKLPLSENLNFSETEIRNLRRRVIFWSNYQSRFYNFKIYFPEKTLQVLKNSGINLPDHGTINNFTVKKNTEICILEFEDKIVIEFLRGHASETKIIEKDIVVLKNLFNDGRLDIKYLESINSLAEHDHFIYWQSLLEALLRKRFNILPDANLKKFKVTETYSRKYDFKFGLGSLTSKQQIERDNDIRKINSKYSCKKTQLTSREKAINYLFYSPHYGWVFMDRSKKIVNNGIWFTIVKCNDIKAYRISESRANQLTLLNEYKKNNNLNMGLIMRYIDKFDEYKNKLNKV